MGATMGDFGDYGRTASDYRSEASDYQRLSATLAGRLSPWLAGANW